MGIPFVMYAACHQKIWCERETNAHDIFTAKHHMPPDSGSNVDYRMLPMHFRGIGLLPYLIPLERALETGSSEGHLDRSNHHSGSRFSWNEYVIACT